MVHVLPGPTANSEARVLIDPLSDYAKIDGTVKTVVLWNPVDLGYLTVYAARKLAEEGQLPEEFVAGRLGKVRVVGTQILLGPPMRFTKENIGRFDF